MSFSASLESVLQVEGTKIGLGKPKPEDITLSFPSPRRGELKRSDTEPASKYQTEYIQSQISDGEYIEVAVVSTDNYEIKYLDTRGEDKEAITYVQYTHGNVSWDDSAKKWKRDKCTDEDVKWLDLKTAHVFKYRAGIIELSELKEVTFRVWYVAIPKDGSLKVEVHIGASKKP